MSFVAAANWLSFRLGDQQYATPLLNVCEVARELDITPVPGAPDDLLGVCHLRGQIVPVMDGRLRLGLADSPAGDGLDGAIVMLAWDNQLAGLRVDGIGEMLCVVDEQIDPAPMGTMRKDDPVTGVFRDGGHFLALLDVARLFKAQTH